MVKSWRERLSGRGHYFIDRTRDANQWLYPCLIVPLSDCTPVWLYPCLIISLSDCIPVCFQSAGRGAPSERVYIEVFPPSKWRPSSLSNLLLFLTYTLLLHLFVTVLSAIALHLFLLSYQPHCHRFAHPHLHTSWDTFIFSPLLHLTTFSLHSLITLYNISFDLSCITLQYLISKAYRLLQGLIQLVFHASSPSYIILAHFSPSCPL